MTSMLISRGRPWSVAAHSSSPRPADPSAYGKSLALAVNHRIKSSKGAGHQGQSAAGGVLSPPRRDSHVASFKLSTDARLSKRTAELAVREMYLTNFWYAATFSRELSANKPYRTKLLDTDVLLWRDQATSKVVCMTAACPVTEKPISVDEQVVLTTYHGDDEKAKSAMYAPQQKPHVCQLTNLPTGTLL